MATIQLDPSGSYTEHSILATGNAVRRTLFPAIRWGAVIAGVAVGVSVQLALTLLGIASGLSATNVSQGETIGSGPLLWAGFSMLIAAFVGGYVAARMTGLKRKIDGVLHGVVSWAVTTLLFATLATSAGGAIVSGVFSSMSSMASATVSNAGSSGGVAAMLKNQIGANVSADAMKTLQQQIQAGQRDEAIKTMVNKMDVEQSRAGTVVDQALIISGSPSQASAQGRAAADRAISTAGTAAWTVFLAVALSLALGIFGGVMGAVGARRTTWDDAGDMAEDAAGRRPM